MLSKPGIRTVRGSLHRIVRRVAVELRVGTLLESEQVECAGVGDDVNTQSNKDKRHNDVPVTSEDASDGGMVGNGVTNKAPDSEEHIKGKQRNTQAGSVAVGKQRRVNADVVASVGKCDRSDSGCGGGGAGLNVNWRIVAVNPPAGYRRELGRSREAQSRYEARCARQRSRQD